MSNVHRKFVHGKNPTIGILVDWVSNDFQVSILSGIYDSAKKLGMNLICFEGGVLKRPKTQDLHDYCRNIIYSFAYKNAVDGLILLSATLGHEISSNELFEFCRSFSPIPMVSIARKIPDIPSVLVDNKKGLRDLLNHLIGVHKCERFVLLKGNDNDDDGRERHDVFKEVMRDHDLPIDADLMLEGNFYTSTAEKELARILENGRADFQAIVSVNDDMAFGALKVCRLKGLAVPRDCIVTGFDDVRQSSFVEPPLTTVKQPLRELGITAVDLVIRQIQGETVPLEVIVPTSLMIRESCGCLPVQTLQFGPLAGTKKTDVEAEKKKAIEQVTRLIEKLFLPHYERAPAELARTLVSELEHSLSKKNPESFLAIWDNILQNLYITFDNNYIIDSILKELCSGIAAFARSDVERKSLVRIYENAIELVKKRAIKLEQQLNFEFIHSFNALSDLRDALIATQDTAQFSSALERKLLVLDIEELYIALYHEGSIGPAGTSRLIFGIQNKKLLPLKSSRECFPSGNFLPDALFPEEPFAFHIDSLNYTNHLFGFILFGLNPTNGVTYSNLRRIISNALYGSYLFKRVRKHHNRLKMQKEELNASLEKYHVAMAGFINTLVKTIEVRDPYTAGHQRRVADLARKIGEEMALSNELVETIRMAAIIHDLGKIYIPAEILNKPGKILDIEFNLIKNHPQIAYDILKSINFPWPIADVVFQHHERLDGSGYPMGIKGSDIALPARIISVADVVEAMGSRRPYREALGIDKALEEISEKKGILYDPLTVEICITLFTRGGYSLKTDQNIQ
jgi:HD-GYP domain-containing protein (c-di-GMP phosphodiesterase class II)/DNA-binding LacI/PurR family transcriptional regulator